MQSSPALPLPVAATDRQSVIPPISVLRPWLAGGLWLAQCLGNFLVFIASREAGLSPMAAGLVSLGLSGAAYGLLAHHCDRRRAMSWPRLGIMLLLAILLQASLWQAAGGEAGAPGLAALLILAMSGTAVLAVERFLPAFDSALEGDDARAWHRLAGAFVAVMIVLRLLYQGQIELLPEEAYYWNYAQHPSWGYLDHPPMVAWLITLWTKVLGHNEFAVRFGATICWLVSASFSYAFTRNLFGQAAAPRALMILAILPFFFATGLLMTPDAPLVACWSATLYFLERALLGERRKAWWGVGCAIGLGMLSKYTIALLGPATLLFILLDRRSRPWYWRPEPYVAVVLALLLFSPVIIWNASHEWASFAFQGARRVSQAPKFSTHMLLGAVVALITPMGLLAAVQYLIGRPFWRRPDANEETRRKHHFLLLMTLVPLSVFTFFSLKHEIKINWAGPLWLAMVPVMAWRLGTPVTGAGAFWNWLNKRTVWYAMGLVLLVCYAVILQHLAFGIPGLPYPAKLRVPVGWRAMAAALAATAERVEKETGKECLYIGMDKYFVTSELAFYDKEDGSSEAAGRHLLGATSLMYRYWFMPTDFAGSPVILVSLQPDTLKAPYIARRFGEMSEITAHELKRGDQVVGKFYYAVGLDYRPPMTGYRRAKLAQPNDASDDDGQD